MTDSPLTTKQRLTLWAGQCWYPTKQARAVAIAIAAFAKPLDWQGKAGRLTLDPPLLMLTAREIAHVPDLDPPMTAAILRWLLLSGYLTRQPSAGDMPGLAGLPVFVDTSCLPVRVNELDTLTIASESPPRDETAPRHGMGHASQRASVHNESEQEAA
jgi:hypothetical protein